MTCYEFGTNDESFTERAQGVVSSAAKTMSTDRFQLVYDGPEVRQGSMDVYALAPALLSLGDLVRGPRLAQKKGEPGHPTLRERIRRINCYVDSEYPYKSFPNGHEVGLFSIDRGGRMTSRNPVGKPAWGERCGSKGENRT